MAKSDKTEIFIHCLATRPEWGKNRSIKSIVDEVRKWHKKDNGWSDIAYAAVIGYDGSVGMGRDLDKDGDYFEETAAAARGYNKSAIHLALVGGFGGTANDKFSKHYSVEQEEALRATIEEVFAYLGKEVPIRGHNEVAAKACPCFDVPSWYREKPRSTNPVIGSSTIKAVIAGVTGLVTAATPIVTTIKDMDTTVQVALIGGTVVTGLAFLWIFKERLQKWGSGVR